MPPAALINGRAKARARGKERGRVKRMAKAKAKASLERGCAICGDPNHWKNECPKNTEKGPAKVFSLCAVTQVPALAMKSAVEVSNRFSELEDGSEEETADEVRETGLAAEETSTQRIEEEDGHYGPPEWIDSDDERADDRHDKTTGVWEKSRRKSNS